MQKRIEVKTRTPPPRGSPSFTKPSPRDQLPDNRSVILSFSEASVEQDNDAIITENLQTRAHSETLNFLQKYFPGALTMQKQPIQIQKFTECVLNEFEDLWSEQDISKFKNDFNAKMLSTFGDWVDVNYLCQRTLRDGMIGLIVDIFRQYKRHGDSQRSSISTTQSRLSTSRTGSSESVQNLKNILQEYMEGFYQQLQSQVYSKFNTQMRRMVLKYKDANKCLKRAEDILNTHIDLIQADKLWKQKQATYLKKISTLTEQNKTLRAEANSKADLHAHKLNQLQNDLTKAQTKIQKYENIMLSRMNEKENNRPSLPQRPTIIFDKPRAISPAPHPLSPSPKFITPTIIGPPIFAHPLITTTSPTIVQQIPRPPLQSLADHNNRSMSPFKMPSNPSISRIITLSPCQTPRK